MTGIQAGRNKFLRMGAYDCDNYASADADILQFFPNWNYWFKYRFSVKEIRLGIRYPAGMFITIIMWSSKVLMFERPLMICHMIISHKCSLVT